jgi:exopolysaccharide production protein ExoZ
MTGSWKNGCPAVFLERCKEAIYSKYIMQPKKLNSLQAGRGIAALMVVLYHANGRYGFGGRHLLGHIFSFGFAGVDFFFVLSGFIIAYTSFHLIGRENGLQVFARKRILRVYPIYWLYLTVAVFAGYFFYQDNHVLDNFWKTILLLPDHHFVIATSWTLPFEIFFYFVFALVVFSRWSLVVVIPIAVISIINAVLQNIGGYGIFHDKLLNDLCSPFNVEFLLGFLSYKIYNKIGKPVISSLLLLVVAAMVLEILYFKRADYGEIYPGMRVLPFGLLAFAAVTAFAALDHLDLFKAPAFLVTLGDASYTLYLIHANIFNFLYDQLFAPAKLSEEAVMILMEFVVPATVVLSFILYKYVEKPLLKRAGSIWKERVVELPVQKA